MATREREEKRKKSVKVGSQKVLLARLTGREESQEKTAGRKG